MEEVIVIMAKCNKNGKSYGIRVENNDENKWRTTWAFRISEKNAKIESYDKCAIEGKIMVSSGYPGCPHCSSSSFFKCKCGKLSCWDGYSSEVTCAWCGEKSNIEGTIRELEGEKF